MLYEVITVNAADFAEQWLQVFCGLFRREPVAAGRFNTGEVFHAVQPGPDTGGPCTGQGRRRRLHDGQLSKLPIDREISR